MMFPRHLLLASLVLALVVLGSAPANADISLKEVPTVEVPALDIEALNLDDIERDRNGLAPRYAVPEPVTITPITHGRWTKMNSETAVWRLRTRCKNAISMNYGFSRWLVPVGGEMRIYNMDRTHRIRAFTIDDIQDTGVLWTPAVAGNDVIIEITCALEDRWMVEQEVELSSINPGYRGFHEFFGIPPSTNTGPSMSGSCNVDVVCPQSATWENEIDCVGVISTGGSLFCTGFMVNNTAQDGTPFFMTADHCGVTGGNAGSLVVYWNYENSTCRPPGSASSGGPGNGTLNQFSTGSIYRSGSATSDYTLVELTSPPNPAFGVSFCGWNASTSQPTSAVGIHHPNVEEKRISFENQAPTLTTNFVTVNDWDLGTTEPGSSGSPLFDQNHRVIGQLCCGSAACGNNFSDDYGRFSRSWGLGLGAWLDVANTGQLTVDTLPAGGGGGPGTENCSNGTDDDGDGLADCDDPDCFNSPACLPAGAGDECSTAFIAVEGANAVDTTAMTTGIDPISDAQCPGSFLGVFNQDAWYSFTPAASGSMDVSTCDAISFDSDLAVYSGGCGNLTQIACNGDGATCGGFTSLITGVAVTGGSEYLIRMGGWDGTANGTGTLTITVGGGGPATENCTNGTDDDGDGLIDCADPDCANNPACGGGGGNGDECIDAILVTEGANAFDTTGMTDSPEPDPTGCPNAYGENASDGWFLYIANFSGDVTIETCDINSFDTDLAAYSGNCGNLSLIACDGDGGTAAGCQGFDSMITIPGVQAGDNIILRVGGWGTADQGPGTLTITVGGGGPGTENCTNGTDDDGDGLIDCADPDCANSPACGGGGGTGDECIDAIIAVDGANAVDNTAATTGVDPISDAQCAGTFLGQFVSDVWYSYVATSTGAMDVSTCNSISFDSDIAIYTGTCGALTQIACNGDGTGCAGFTSLVSGVGVTAGTEYLIRVGGFGAGTGVGTGTMTITVGGGGPGGGTGDECIDAILVTEGANAFDTTGMTDSPEPDPTGCPNAYGENASDGWFLYIANSSGDVTVETCDINSFDTDLAAYSGGCGSLNLLACDGDGGAPGCQAFSSMITIPGVQAGDNIILRVGGWGAADQGPGTLTITVGGGGPGTENCTNGTDDDGDGLIDCADPDCAADPACGGGGNQGDECNDPLIAVVGSNAVDTTAMTSSADPYNDAACVGTALGVMAGDAWYQFSAPVSGTATVSTCDLITFDSDLVAYTGACGALTQVACNGDGTGCGGFTSLMEMSVTAGTNYLIRIGGWSVGEQGTGTLEITLAGAPNPENCTNGTDDDGDGDVDCEDTDCDQDPACVTPPENCTNGTDDDGDGLADCDDPDCTADPACQAPPSGFAYTAVDVTASYAPSTGTGSFSATLNISEDSAAVGYPNDTQGFSFGIANDPGMVSATTWTSSAVLEGLNSSSGPDFIDVNFYSDGVTVGCVYSFANTSILEFTSDTPMGSIDYDTVPSGLIGNSTGATTSLSWSGSLGSPAVVNIVVVDGQAMVAALNNGTVILTPSTGGFIRGDINDDSVINIADAVSMLAGLFTGGAINCDDAADCNDDGSVNIADAVYELANLFSGGPAMPAPTAPTCGPDPTSDSLDCAIYNSCI